jgi:putative ABC transport system permease protein
MRDLVLDLRYAARILRQNPGFAIVAIVTLALGIGGTTAIFSVLDPVLIRPLAYREPERLVSVSTYFPSMKLETLTSADYAQFERESHVFESIAAYPHGLETLNLVAAGAPVRASRVKVTPSFLSTLGVAPLLGRGFAIEESRPEPAEVAVLTYGLWMRTFGGDTGIVGRSITLDQQTYTVIGVLPGWFRFPEEEKVDLLTPLPLDDARLEHGPQMRTWRAIARLKPGVSLETARAELETIFARIRAQYKWFYRNDVQLRIVPLHAHQVREVRLSLLVLAGAVAFVLLIACVNVAHILMARAASRAREIAVRAALGAGRLRLVRQLLTESVLLGLLGGAAGWLVAYAGVKLAVPILPADIPHIDQVAVDLRTLGFTALAAVTAGLLFGLAPAWTALRTNLIETLKLGGGAPPGSTRQSLRGGLLVAEIAFSMVLLTGSALLIESLWHLENTPLGFDPERVFAVSIPLQGTDTQEAGRRQKRFQHDAIERVAQLPGVAAVALADSLPPTGAGAIQTFSREDRPLPEPGHRGDNMLVRAVSADYFRVMGIPLVRGRLFAASENRESAVVIVNQALVRRYFPNEDSLGKRIGGIRPDPKWKTIVGIVGDEKNDGLRSDPQPKAYLPIEQAHRVEDAWLIARTVNGPPNIAGAIERELRALDHTRPVTVETMPKQIADLVARPRFQTMVMSIFSALALVMAAVGVYGVASWAVSQRTREIGVRMALGAAPADVLRLVLGSALGPIGLGLLIGTAGALAAGRFLESLLFGVKPADVGTLVSTGFILAATVLVATYIPARRAAGANPAVTLRSE